MSNLWNEQLRNLHKRFKALYPGQEDRCMARMEILWSRYRHLQHLQHGGLWTQKDAVLITYGDMVRSEDAFPRPGDVGLPSGTAVLAAKTSAARTLEAAAGPNAVVSERQLPVNRTAAESGLSRFNWLSAHRYTGTMSQRPV